MNHGPKPQVPDRVAGRIDRWSLVLLLLIAVTGTALLLQRPSPPTAQPLRVSKPPSSKLYDPGQHEETLRLPAPPEARGRLQQDAIDQDTAAAVLQRIIELRSDPARWLEWISHLQTQGHEGLAAAELAAFRQSYPEHPVPDGFGE